MKSISTLFRQLSLIVVLISAFSLSAWGGEEIISNTFSSTTMQKSVSSYTDTWNNISGIELKLANFNNNNKGWNYVKCGRKSNASVGTITTTSPLTEKITKVVVTIDAVTTKNVNSTYLEVASDASFTQNLKKINVNIAKGDLTYEIPTPTANCYYKLTYDCKSGSNGLVTISKVDFYYNTSCTNPEISFTEPTVTKTKGDANFTNKPNIVGSTGDVTYTTGNKNVATVNVTTGEVTIVDVGKTTITATVAADGTYCEATAEYTLTVEGRTFDITWMNGTESYETTTYTEGQPLTLPAQNPKSCSDNYSTFVGWYTASAGKTSSSSTSLEGLTEITAETKPEYNADGVTYHAVFGSNNTSAITETASIDFSAQNYTNQQEITSCKIGEATVTFDKGTNSNTPKYYTSGTAIRVYGGGYFIISSETTISSITITFGSDDGTNEITTNCGSFTSPTWTGSANSVKFTIGGSSGNRRIKGISVTTTSLSSSAYISTCDGEEVINPNAPTFNPAGGDFTETQQVTISAQDGTSIYYTTNGDDPTTESTLYNGAIEISTTTTIKAIAVLDGVESAISETEYRINIVDDIATFITKAPTVETKISGTVTVIAQDQWKQRTWIQDANGSAMIDNSSKDVELTFGDQLKGIVGTFSSNNINVTYLPEKEATTATPTTKETKTIGEITTNDLHKYIRIENVTFGGVNGSNATFTDETNSIKTYESYLQTDYSSINEGQKVNLNAIVGIYNDVLQIYVVSFDVVREPAIYADDIVDFGDVIENNESTKTITITTVDLGESASISVSGTNASCFEVNTNTIDGNSETEITITFTAPDVDVETEYTATLTITGGGQTKKIALTANVYEAYTIKFGNTEKETNAKGKVTEIPTLDGVVGWTTNSVFAIVDEKPNVIDENTIFEENTQLYPVYSITEEGQEEAWTLVTDASTLAVGDQVVIAAADYNYALSTNQKSNNRGQISIIKNNNTITLNNEVQILTLEEGTTSGTFAFNTGSGYLYAASSSSNHLKTKDDKDADGSWKITITDGVASIVAQGTNTRSTMQYNQSSSLFACYESASQKAIALYKKTGGAITKYNIAGNKTIENNTTFGVENNININTLTIKSNFDEAGEVNVTAGALSANKVIIEKTIDASRWFFFSLPFDCDLNNVVATHSNGTQLKYADSPTTGDYVINYYDQTRNATTNKAWVELIDTSYTLKANQGYIIGHFGTGDVTVKFPSKDAVTISVPATKTLNYTDSWTAGDVENSTNGWNLIGMPYYQKPNNSSLSADINVYFATIPNDDGKTYTQTTFADADIAPFTSFFVQTTEAPTFTIAAQQNAAPMLRAKGEASKAVISLVDANGVDDKTTIINNPNNTNDYEIGHDLAKWIGYAARPQIYSIQGDDILAFNSLAIDNSTIIPLGVYAHTDGEYTFRLSEKSVGDLEGWELYDNETGKTTRLANEDLTIYLEQGTHEGRFEIRLQQRITTDCDNSMGDMMTWTANGTLNINNMPTDAVVYIYDAVGRMIYVATPNANTFNYSFVARGVYNIVVRSADNTVSFKTIY